MILFSNLYLICFKNFKKYKQTKKKKEENIESESLIHHAKLMLSIDIRNYDNLSTLEYSRMQLLQPDDS